MPELTELAPEWERRLKQLVQDLDVPGAAVGVSHRGERVVLSAGVESLRSGHPVIDGTAFQIGSISKVYTATLLAAVSGLDAELLAGSVAELIPEAGWMDPRITVAHLLTHSSGIAGDCFTDSGRGDDALSRYVSGLRELPADAPGEPGRHYSYCNSGYAVLGRLIEVLCGMSYEAALREHLLEPLGAGATSALPEQTLLGAHAAGHNRFPGRPLAADEVWNFTRAATPLGGICATAADLLSFAEMHLADGLAADGRRVIPARAARSMRTSHLRAPAFARPAARGLGWGIYDTDRGAIIGHDGETLGQIAKLRIVPEHGLALTVLTNAIPDGNRIARALERAILRDWDITLTTVAVTPVERFDPAPYLGRYRNFEGLIEVSASEHGLTLRDVTEAEGLWQQEQRSELVPIGGGAFVETGEPAPLSAQRFSDIDERGRCRTYFNGRIFRRVPDEGA